MGSSKRSKSNSSKMSDLEARGKRLKSKLGKVKRKLEKKGTSKKLERKRAKYEAKLKEQNKMIEEEKRRRELTHAESKRLCPMSKEEWEKRQSVLRHELDPETNRVRLVKGDGEIMEEIVSKERHQQINRNATTGDGQSFQNCLKSKL